MLNATSAISFLKTACLEWSKLHISLTVGRYGFVAHRKMRQAWLTDLKKKQDLFIISLPGDQSFANLN